MIYVGAQGEIYIPTPYHSSLKANYDFDEINEQIIYQFMDQLYNEIAKIHVTFKPNR
ncbi:hypothetical protein KKG31_07770 [Patescibacteria group bacterium]|nr:hypothetical protein [Patescibacteria group bacterium]MBU1758963.1 hypothetical protein [Patescibacteria group bacterium]